MSYTNTLIEIAPDSDATESTVPTSKRPKKPAHIIQYELLAENPYTFDHKQLIYEVHVRHKEIADSELVENGQAIYDQLYSKGQPCMRASNLTKKFGWGAHYNDEGKIALVGVGTAEYDQLVADESVKKRFAMRSKR